MIAVRLLWLAVLLVAMPAWVGNCFLNVDKPCRNPVFLWISGQMLLWAGFQRSVCRRSCWKAVCGW